MLTRAPPILKGGYSPMNAGAYKVGTPGVQRKAASRRSTPPGRVLGSKYEALTLRVSTLAADTA